MVNVDITPDFPVELIGGSWKDPVTETVFSRHFMQVLVMERGGHRFVLAAVDSLGLTVELGLRLREVIAGVIGASADAVMLSFTHTHEAPAPLSPVNGARYFDLLCQKGREAAQKALARLVPCLGAWALAPGNVGENRRQEGGAVDDRLGLLRLTDPAGKPLALVARVTAHNNILLRGVAGEAMISADHFGRARELLAGLFGCPVMLIQGAAGNIRPRGVHAYLGGSPADVERVALLVARAARCAVFGAPVPLDPRVFTRSITYTAPVPGEEEARAVADRARAECGSDGARWLAECARLRGAGVREQTLTEPFAFFLAAGGCLCGVPSELFAELSLDAWWAAGNPLFFLNGYTDGCTAYLPSAAEWDRGGYEVLYSLLDFFPFHGHVMPFRRGTAQQIVNFSCRTWQESKEN